MLLTKSVAAANSAVAPISRKFVALYHRNTKIGMRSDESNAITVEVLLTDTLVSGQL